MANVRGDDSSGGRNFISKVAKGSGTDRPAVDQQPAVQRDHQRRVALDVWKRPGGRRMDRP